MRHVALDGMMSLGRELTFAQAQELAPYIPQYAKIDKGGMAVILKGEIEEVMAQEQVIELSRKILSMNIKMVGYIDVSQDKKKLYNFVILKDYVKKWKNGAVETICSS